MLSNKQCESLLNLRLQEEFDLEKFITCEHEYISYTKDGELCLQCGAILENLTNIVGAK